MKRNNISVLPQYFDRYIYLLKEEDELFEVLDFTAQQLELQREYLHTFQNFSYAQRKWTPKDILQHINDTERILSYRALVFSRNDKTPLTGFDEYLYSQHANASQRSIEELLEEFALVRKNSIQLLKSFTPEMMQREGVVSGIVLTPLAIGFTLAGHVVHHIQVLKKLYFH